MSYLVAISCSRDERKHAEMLKAFLLEELGESVPGVAGAPPEPTVYSYVDEPRPPDSLLDDVDKIYEDCAVMAAIIGASYHSSTVAAREGQILSARASARRPVAVALIAGVALPPGVDVALRHASPIPDGLPAEPLNSTGFRLLREFARKIVAALAQAGKKPRHPREARGLVNGAKLPIRRHLGGLEYVFKEAAETVAREGVLSSAVLLGRLEQAQRAAAVATALLDLGALAAEEAKGEAGANPLADVATLSFTKLHQVATALLSELATRTERQQVLTTFPIALRVKLLLRIEHYMTRHIVENASSDKPTDGTPLTHLTEPLQDIVLPDPTKNPIRLPRQARSVLQEKAARVAQDLSNYQWRCVGKLSQVEAPRGLSELERFRADNERHLETQPRPL